jgi:hypothetical protein
MESLPVSIKNRLNSRRKRSIRSSRSGPSRPPVQQLSALGLMATALACQLLPTPAKAYQVFFNAPNVLGGIRGVAISMPSTGETNFYDVIFKKGTLAEVYGDPPILDLDNANDAQTIMERSASAINAFIAAASDDSLSFGEAGQDAYYIPFGSPYINSSGTTLVNISASGKECPAGYYWNGKECVYLPSVPTNLPVPHGQRLITQRLITPRLVSIPIDQVTVWSDLQRSMEASATPVPGPLPLAGAWVGWRWARRLRRLTQQG